MPTSYTIHGIASLLKAELLQKADDQVIEHLALDTRTLHHPESSLFFAIKGKRHDGHAYIGEAYQQGVRNFIVTTAPNDDLPEANMLRVNDATQALHKLTARHRQKFIIPIIGITGSNGKTIVKEWLSQLLELDYHIIRSPKSYNSQVGVPLSVWQMNDQHEVGIFEAGISQVGEMEALQHIIQPTIGIFTNIGPAHDEGFLNRQHKVKEKLKLFFNTDILIYCNDYQEITQGILDSRKSHHDENNVKFTSFTWSMQGNEADLPIRSVEKKNGATTISAVHHEEPIAITIPFTDDASIENAIHCWALMIYLRYEQGRIEERMQELGQVAMRLELKNAVNNCSLINDSYNSDLHSLSIALDFLNQQQQHAHKTLILSDILQSGMDEQELYQQVSRMIQQKGVDRFIGVGQALSRHQALFKSNNELPSSFYSSTDQLLKELSADDFQNEGILLKGARAFGFEQIGNLLEQKVHETVLEIDLRAIANNLNVYHGYLNQDTRIMAMVKAFSYGSGSYEIANLLQFHRVDYLAVAYADEGVALRQAGITLPIVVLNPERRSFATMMHHNLEPEIYSRPLLEEYEKAVFDKETVADVEPFPIHLMLDTGMHRLGFEEGDLTWLVEKLKDSPYLQVETAFSHLAASGDNGEIAFTREQIDLFDRMSNELMEQLGYSFLRHILNSGGILRYPEAQYDMVRLGLGMYGIDTTGQVADQLEPVSSLQTTISQIKYIPAGDTVGYGRQGKAEHDMTIATVGLGYADGVSYQLSNGKGAMLVNGQQAPIVGTVCMDMCMLDVTHIENVQEGDEVIVFGRDLPVEKVAKWANTIPYEILASIPGRVKRVYYQE